MHLSMVARCNPVTGLCASVDAEPVAQHTAWSHTPGLFLPVRIVYLMRQGWQHLRPCCSQLLRMKPTHLSAAVSPTGQPCRAKNEHMPQKSYDSGQQLTLRLLQDTVPWSLHCWAMLPLGTTTNNPEQCFSLQAPSNLWLSEVGDITTMLTTRCIPYILKLCTWHIRVSSQTVYALPVNN